MAIKLTEYMQNGVLLLDGGIGQELRHRTQSGDDKLWGAHVLLEQPEVVQQLHEDYIRAGAKVITTNTYSTVRHRLAEHTDLGDRFVELLNRAGRLSQQAREVTGEKVLIAGSLPPLYGSYRPDLVRSYEEIAPIYHEHVEILAPYVDLFICETMSSGQEGYAAAHAATAAGKPVWVAWTLKDDDSKRLRNGETLREAWQVLKDLPIQAALVNCCSPESITAAMPEVVNLGAPLRGGFANGFAAIPEKWNFKEGVSKLGNRPELTPAAYAEHVQSWIKAGATLVGGCCETGPTHIKRIHELIVSS